MTSSEDERALLIRLDERMAAVYEDIREMKNHHANFVTKAEFRPVRAIVFGAVALVLVGFMGALVALTGLSPS